MEALFPPPKPTLITLPQEVLLNIADHFLSDYLLWKTQLKYLRKATFHLDHCPYINLARTHPYLWNVLLARRFAKGALDEAASADITTAPAVARREERRQQRYRKRELELYGQAREVEKPNLGRLLVLE